MHYISRLFCLPSTNECQAVSTNECQILETWCKPFLNVCYEESFILSQYTPCVFPHKLASFRFNDGLMLTWLYFTPFKAVFALSVRFHPFFFLVISRVVTKDFLPIPELLFCRLLLRDGMNSLNRNTNGTMFWLHLLFVICFSPKKNAGLRTQGPGMKRKPLKMQPEVNRLL